MFAKKQISSLVKLVTALDGLLTSNAPAIAAAVSICRCLCHWSMSFHSFSVIIEQSLIMPFYDKTAFVF